MTFFIGRVLLVLTLLLPSSLAGDVGLEQALWREADAQAQCYPTPDLMEGVTAVAEKRKPNFTGMEDFKD